MVMLLYILVVLGGLHLLVYYGSMRLYRWLDDRAFGYSKERIQLTQRVSALEHDLAAVVSDNQKLQSKLVDVFEVLRPALTGEKPTLVLSSDAVRRRLQ